MELDYVGMGDDKAVYATIRIDNLTIGMVRLPNNEYLLELRRRVQCLPTTVNVQTEEKSS